MKPLFLIVCLALLVNCLTPVCTLPSEECEDIELSSMDGLWYELGQTQIIRYTVERNCKCVKYSFLYDALGMLEVIKHCRRSNRWALSIGQAIPLSESKLHMNFDHGLSRMFFNRKLNVANYEILNAWVDRRGRYQIALIVVPHHANTRLKGLDAVWILSREEHVVDELVNVVLSYAKKAGYHISSSNFKRSTC